MAHHQMRPLMRMTKLPETTAKCSDKPATKLAAH